MGSQEEEQDPQQVSWNDDDHTKEDADHQPSSALQDAFCEERFPGAEATGYSETPGRFLPGVSLPTRRARRDDHRTNQVRNLGEITRHLSQDQLQPLVLPQPSQT